MRRRAGLCFDQGSGLVYTERICRAGPIVPDWVSKTRGSLDQFKNFVNPGPGCSSLTATAMHCILANVFDLTTDALEALPMHLVRRVWEEITER